MRKSFVKELIKIAKKQPSCLLLVGDVGYNIVEEFATAFPRQFINTGIAEQNMAGVAAGLASEGFKVFVYSIGNFATFRCAEQIRNDIAYHNLPVTIVTVGSGLSYGNAGYSHHLVQDYALMRCFPNLTIASPADILEMSGCIKYIMSNKCPSYLRLGNNEEKLTDNKNLNLLPGQWIPIKRKKGNDRAIITTGTALKMVLEVLNAYKCNTYDVFSLPIWSTDSKKLQTPQANNYKTIYTVEEHFVDGGFGSWFLEALHQNNDSTAIPIVKPITYNNSIYDKTGNAEELITQSEIKFQFRAALGI